MSNRFKCLLEDTYRPNQRERERTRPRHTYRREPTFERVITAEEIVGNKSNFPSLTANAELCVEQTLIEHGHILSPDINQPNLELVESTKMKRGWEELKGNHQKTPTTTKTKNTKEISNTTNYVNREYYRFFISCMTNLYEHQTNEKMDILGEEIYDREFKFQNYNYQYFDELDEQFEAELEQYNAQTMNEVSLYSDGGDNSV